MKPDSRRIRELIGDNQIEQAIRLLIEYSEQADQYDLLDQTILQKSRFSDYNKKFLGGFGDDKEINAIRSALLDINREALKRAEQPVHPSVPETPENIPNKIPPPLQPPNNPAQEYFAQCFFNGDPNTYFVLKNSQIVVVNQMTRIPIQVAARTAALNPAFSWIYQFPNGMYYSIDHAGVIWGVNAFGMPVQMGYVQYF
ncbi:MAG: hypothetical protein WCR52_05075 [Bacteroidota bacterium]